MMNLGDEGNYHPRIDLHQVPCGGPTRRLIIGVQAVGLGENISCVGVSLRSAVMVMASYSRSRWRSLGSCPIRPPGYSPM